MRVRYQRGYLRLGHRKTGPDCWEFLWWDIELTGQRVRRKFHQLLKSGSGPGSRRFNLAGDDQVPTRLGRCCRIASSYRAGFR